MWGKEEGGPCGDGGVEGGAPEWEVGGHRSALCEVCVVMGLAGGFFALHLERCVVAGSGRRSGQEIFLFGSTPPVLDLGLSGY